MPPPQVPAGYVTDRLPNAEKAEQRYSDVPAGYVTDRLPNAEKAVQRYSDVTV
ncbi:hypothetical protein J6590_008709 [Homalodisca vitripennis]|nr:hypothetical protein J6590_008709 [Homalodisca vitripennis]